MNDVKKFQFQFKIRKNTFQLPLFNTNPSLKQVLKQKQRFLNQYFLSPVTWRIDILVLFITGDLQSRYFVYHL